MEEIKGNLGDLTPACVCTLLARVFQYVMAHDLPQNAICFYTTKDTHGYMSNFARFKVECFGQVWMTSEHAYQAQKFSGSDDDAYARAAAAKNPKEAAAIGRDPLRKMRDDWMQVRDDVMRFVVFHKFNQNATIKEKLLATGDLPLYEQDMKRGDQYWAVDSAGVGKNMLGRILMEVRDVLREEEEFKKHHQDLVAGCVACVPGDKLCRDHDKSSSPANVYLLSLLF